MAADVIGALGPDDRARALALLNGAIDYGVTALGELDRKRSASAHDSIVDLLVILRDLRNLLSPDPAMERPIGSEVLQEWMR